MKEAAESDSVSRLGELGSEGERGDGALAGVEEESGSRYGERAR